MPSNPEPTAAAETLVADLLEEMGDADYADVARVVVAAIRPLIAAEALRSEADTLERAVPSEDAMPTMFVVPAHIWLRDRAEFRLRAANQSEEGQR
jgi:hypothetical protein